METLGVLAPQVATINRVSNSDFGSINFINNSSPITIVGYSILSNEGALRPAGWTSIADNYDFSGNKSVDANDEWLELTAATSRTDISEFEPDGNGATLATGQSISFGNAWIQNPTEDVTMELLLSDGTILPVSVQYAGNGGERFDFGDLDFDGDFDVTDFTGSFVPGFGANTAALSSAEKYQAGDFNENNLVDEFDFLIYNQAYLAANPGASALSFATVPEPSALALFSLAGVVAAFGRRRSKQCTLRPLAFASLTIAFLASIANQADAANAVAYWNFNEPASATQLNDVIGANDSITVGAAVSGAPGKIGSAWTFGGTNSAIEINSATGNLTGLGQNYSFSTWVKSTDNLGVILSVSDTTQPSEEVTFRVSDNGDPDGRVGVLGRPVIDGPGNEALSTSHVNNNQWRHVVYTSSNTGWKMYVDGVLENSGAVTSSPLAIGANAVHIGVNRDSVGLEWGVNGTLDDMAVWDAPLTDSEVSNMYVKGLFGVGATTAFTDALSLDVNRTSGATSLKNTSGTAFEIDLYRVVSAGNSLQSSAWNSLDDQNVDAAVWTELAKLDGKVSEGAFGESTSLAGGFSQPLGNLYKSAVDAQDLILEYHLVGTPSALVIRGNVNYSTGAGLVGDYNGNGKVDAADYTIWRDTLGRTGAGLAADGNQNNQIDNGDYNVWRNNFGASLGSGSGGIADAASVPEPATIWLILGAVLAACGRSFRGGRFALSCSTLLVAVTSASALSTNDREYRLGDDPFESGVVGNTVGSSTGGVTYDSAGSSGTGNFQDLFVNGDPKYANASTRPGAAGTNRGALFDGADDSLSTAISFNAPSDMWDNTTFFPVTPFPQNYETVYAHGISLWAKPTASALGQSRTQGLIFDTLEQGIYITPSDTWGLWFDDFDGPGIDSGVDVNTVANNGWTHVMQLAGFDDPTGGKSRTVGALLVNGVAVAAINSPYDTDFSPLVVGAQSDGLGGQLNHYAGTLDDVRLFLWGNNTGQNSGDGRLGQNWGTLDLAVDNDWIKNQLQTLGVTSRADVNLNGALSGNGTGPAATDDVTAFIQGWRSRRLVNGIQVGDWTSRQNGDLNYDGIVDLRDAFILHQGLIGAGAGGLDFGLLGIGVPEPGTATLFLVGSLALAATDRSRRRFRPLTQFAKRSG